MRTRLILSSLFVTAFFLGCKKENVPQEDKQYYFTYRVKIADKIKEPTIISGFYGHVMEYKGDFMPQISDSTTQTKANKPVPVRNKILLFQADQKEAIESVAYQEEGITYYNLKKLKKMRVEPKYTIVPNKSGFYQFDLGDKEYYILLELKKNKGYYNGGVQLLKGTTSTLQELELRVDHNATF